MLKTTFYSLNNFFISNNLTKKYNITHFEKNNSIAGPFNIIKI